MDPNLEKPDFTNLKLMTDKTYVYNWLLKLKQTINEAPITSSFIRCEVDKLLMVLNSVYISVEVEFINEYHKEEEKKKLSLPAKS